MNIFTPVAILAFGMPLLAVQWAVRKLFGRQISEPAAWGVLLLLTILVVDVGLSLGG